MERLDQYVKRSGNSPTDAERVLRELARQAELFEVCMQAVQDNQVQQLSSLGTHLECLQDNGSVAKLDTAQSYFWCAEQAMVAQRMGRKEYSIYYSEAWLDPSLILFSSNRLLGLLN